MQERPNKQRRKELRASASPREPVRFFSYGRGPIYRVAHACFACRRCFKIASDPTKELVDARCAGCGNPLKWMGRSFRAPRRSDAEQWEKIEALWNAGFRFQSYRSHPEAEPLPERLRDVADFIQRNPSHPFRVRT